SARLHSTQLGSRTMTVLGRCVDGPFVLSAPRVHALWFFQVAVLQSMPFRLLSRAWGAAHNVELPVFARAPVYKFWTWAFDCKLDEMRGGSHRAYSHRL